MIEIRGHGRGGMGAVTMMEILARAAGLDNRFSQAFPTYGAERRGAPVRAFCRISDEPITTRSQVYSPDYVIVLDPTLAELPDVSNGLKQESVVFMNSEKQFSVAGREAKTYNATGLALKILGKNIVNTAMLGAFIRMTGLVSLESLKQVIGERFPGKMGEVNKKLAEEAYNEFGGK
jgi:pyruvate ferredoxin oxidoreductase gamma subunit